MNGSADSVLLVLTGLCADEDLTAGLCCILGLAQEVPGIRQDPIGPLQSRVDLGPYLKT